MNVALCPFLCSISCRAELFCSLWFRNTNLSEIHMLHCVSLPTIQRQIPGQGTKRPKVPRPEAWARVFAASIRQTVQCLLSVTVCLFIVTGGLCVLRSSETSPCAAVMIWFSSLHDSHQSFLRIIRLITRLHSVWWGRFIISDPCLLCLHGIFFK